MDNPTPAQITSAMAACRSIRFAVKNASRYGGEFSLNDILAADRLAREALGEIATPTPRPAKPLKLTAADKKALAAVGDGCDVLDPKLAFTLRAIQKRSPELIWIGEAMGRYASGTHHPYFGAKLTAAGHAAIAPKGGAS